eukprot:7384530-Prymnesium_polylepis.1
MLEELLGRRPLLGVHLEAERHKLAKGLRPLLAAQRGRRRLPRHAPRGVGHVRRGEGNRRAQPAVGARAALRPAARFAHRVRGGRSGLSAVAWRVARAHLRDEEEHAHRVLVRVRRLAHRHLERRDPQRPDVRLGVVLVLANHLGRHPERRADKCAALGHCGGDLAGDAKVGELCGRAKGARGGGSSELRGAQ